MSVRNSLRYRLGSLANCLKQSNFTCRSYQVFDLGDLLGIDLVMDFGPKFLTLDSGNASNIELVCCTGDQMDVAADRLLAFFNCFNFFNFAFF